MYLILRRKLVVIVLLKLYRENNENKQKEAHFFKKKKIRKEALSILNLIFLIYYIKKNSRHLMRHKLRSSIIRNASINLNMKTGGS